MEVRTLDDSYCDAISAIAYQSKAFWGYSDDFMEACRKELTFGPEFFAEHFIKGAFFEGTLAGFYALSKESKGKGDLTALFVLPEFIGKSIGKALVDDCLKSARKIEIKTLTVESDPNAEPFYACFGWVTVGRTPSGSIPGRSLPLMELKL